MHVKVGHAYKVMSKDHYLGTVKSPRIGECVLHLIGNEFDIRGTEEQIREVLRSAYDEFELVERYASTRISSTDVIPREENLDEHWKEETR